MEGDLSDAGLLLPHPVRPQVDAVRAHRSGKLGLKSNNTLSGVRRKIIISMGYTSNSSPAYFLEKLNAKWAESDLS